MFVSNLTGRSGSAHHIEMSNPDPDPDQTKSTPSHESSKQWYLCSESYQIKYKKFAILVYIYIFYVHVTKLFCSQNC